MAEVHQVKGLSQLLENMKQLPAELVSKSGGPVKTALFEATKLVRDDARRRASVATGVLQKNIIAIRDRDPKRSGANERYLVGVRKGRKITSKSRRIGVVAVAGGKLAINDAFYWRFVEFGTQKMKAKPFLRPAFEAQKNNALDTFQKRLGEGLKKIVARMKK